MARMRGSLQTPYDEGMGAPDASGSFASRRGSRPLPSGPSGEGLVNTPFDTNVSTPGGEETPNSMSGLPSHVAQISVDGAPGRDAEMDVPDLTNFGGRTFTG